MIRTFHKSFAFLLAIFAPSALLSTNFKVISDCACPGHVTSYECTVGGNGITIWSGTAFDCSFSNNRIILLHSNFDDGTSVACNDGLLVGRSLNVTNNFYTSRLDVNVTDDLFGRNVECTYDNGIAATTIGSSLISITRDLLLPPSNLKVIHTNSGLITINWDPVATNCSAMHYDISSNCSFCPKIAEANMVSCSIQNLRSDISCDFAVRSVVCGDTVGEWSAPVHLTLKSSSTPTLTTIATHVTGPQTSSVVAAIFAAIIGIAVATVAVTVIVVCVCSLKRKKKKYRLSVEYRIPSPDSKNMSTKCDVLVTDSSVHSKATVLNITSMEHGDFEGVVVKAEDSPLGQKVSFFAHIVIGVEDKPWTLLEVLKVFKDKNINISDMKISERSCGIRNVYMQCDHQLDSETMETMTCQIEKIDCVKFIQFFQSGKELNIPVTEKFKEQSPYIVGYKYTRRLPKQPGMMYEMLNGLRDLSLNNNKVDYRRMSVTDITIREGESLSRRPECAADAVVDLYFVSDRKLPDDWKETFNNFVGFPSQLPCQRCKYVLL